MQHDDIRVNRDLLRGCGAASLAFLSRPISSDKLSTSLVSVSTSDFSAALLITTGCTVRSSDVSDACEDWDVRLHVSSSARKS